MSTKTDRDGRVIGKFVVYRFLDGNPADKESSFNTLAEAYRAALNLKEQDRRPHADYRIQGASPDPSILAQLHLPQPLASRIASFWYVLDSSPAKLPAIRAKLVLLAMGITPTRPAQEAPQKRTQSVLPNATRHLKRSRRPLQRKQREEEPHERHRRDLEVEDRAGDIALVIRPEEELGLGIPAQTNKGRRSRKGEYIP